MFWKLYNLTIHLFVVPLLQIDFKIGPQGTCCLQPGLKLFRITRPEVQDTMLSPRNVKITNIPALKVLTNWDF